MKVSTLVAALTAGTASASVHHGHQQFHENNKRTALGDNSHVATELKTVMMYSYNGKVMDEDSLCKGLNDGSVNWVGTNPPRPACGAKPKPAAKPVVASPAADAGSFHQKAKADKKEPEASYHQKPAPAPKSHPKPSSSSYEGSSEGNNLENGNTDVEFPDGEVDCSEFPTKYGAIAVPWVGFGGWSGIQYAQISNGQVSNLATADTGKKCTPGPGGADAFCSYACPAGFQKSQWPTEQGGSGYQVSVGGLRCGSDNKLYLTNPDLSKSLCTRGTDSLSIVNKLGKGAAVCRTDYPGTEAETVPLYTTPGGSFPLTCPESASYYTHQNMPTTAHYYVNDAGVSVEKACQWGKDESHLGLSYGNWAPIVIGAGKDNNGATWLSIMSSCQNDPQKCNDLSYSIELEGDFGGNNGCYYTQSGGVGHWCSKGSLSDFQPGSGDCVTKATQAVPGCTVQLMSGKATYKFVPTTH